MACPRSGAFFGASASCSTATGTSPIWRKKWPSHREQARQVLEARGVTPAEAEIASRRAFGSDGLAMNRARDVWIAPWVQDLSQDLRFAGVPP